MSCLTILMLQLHLSLIGISRIDVLNLISNKQWSKLPPPCLTIIAPLAVAREVVATSAGIGRDIFNLLNKSAKVLRQNVHAQMTLRICPFANVHAQMSLHRCICTNDATQMLDAQMCMRKFFIGCPKMFDLTCFSPVPCQHCLIFGASWNNLIRTIGRGKGLVSLAHTHLRI